MNIFVAKLNYDTSAESLEDLFAVYGEVKSCKIIFDRETGKSKGFGFVTMATKEAAETAIEQLNELEFEGRTIVVKEAEDRGGNNRGGGGFNRGGGNRGGYDRRNNDRGGYGRRDNDRGGYDRRDRRDY